MPATCQHKVVEIVAIGRSPEELDPQERSPGLERVDEAGICRACGQRVARVRHLGRWSPWEIETRAGG
jgi:hypothetical protein